MSSINVDCENCKGTGMDPVRVGQLCEVCVGSDVPCDINELVELLLEIREHRDDLTDFYLGIEDMLNEGKLNRSPKIKYQIEKLIAEHQNQPMPMMAAPEEIWVNAVAEIHIPLNIPIDADGEDKLDAAAEAFSALTDSEDFGEHVSTISWETVADGEPVFDFDLVPEPTGRKNKDS